jgi:hypothetical protein
MHREERSYSIDVNLVAEFDDAYEGDERRLRLGCSASKRA